MIKEKTQHEFFFQEKSKKHTNDVNDNDLFSLQRSKLLFQISHLRLINLQNNHSKYHASDAKFPQMYGAVTHI